MAPAVVGSSPIGHPFYFSSSKIVTRLIVCSQRTNYCFQIFSTINAPTQLVYGSLPEGVNLGVPKNTRLSKQFADLSVARSSSALPRLWSSCSRWLAFSVIQVFFHFSREQQTISRWSAKKQARVYSLTTHRPQF